MSKIRPFKVYSVTLILLLVFFSFAFEYRDLPESYLSCYHTLLIGFFVYILMVLFMLLNDLHMFEPISLVGVLYLLIFFIRPLQDTLNKEMVTQGGTDMTAGCLKGTVLFLLGMLALMSGYYIKRNSAVPVSLRYTRIIKDEEKPKAYRSALAIWIVCFVLVLVYFLGSGYSLLYVLTVGNNGNADIIGRSSGLMIFSVFKSCLITSWLYIYCYGKNRIIKIITFFLGLSVFLSMGGRSLVITYLAAPLVYHYVGKRTRPGILTIVLLAIAGLSLCVVLEATRNSIRDGAGFNMPPISRELVLSPFDHELTTYKAFYAVTNALPEKTPYCYGEGMFGYTIIMMIPRTVWPSKPDPPIYRVIGESMDDVAVVGGAVYPNIGEFYVEFGPVGVILFMFLFGFLLKHLYRLFRECPQGSHGLFLYAGLFSILLQVTIRGYTPSNFYQVLLTALPVFIISKSQQES